MISSLLRALWGPGVLRQACRVVQLQECQSYQEPYEMVPLGIVQCTTFATVGMVLSRNSISPAFVSRSPLCCHSIFLCICLCPFGCLSACKTLFFSALLISLIYSPSPHFLHNPSLLVEPWKKIKRTTGRPSFASNKQCDHSQVTNSL